MWEVDRRAAAGPDPSLGRELSGVGWGLGSLGMLVLDMVVVRLGVLPFSNWPLSVILNC